MQNLWIDVENKTTFPQVFSSPLPKLWKEVENRRAFPLGFPHYNMLCQIDLTQFSTVSPALITTTTLILML